MFKLTMMLNDSSQWSFTVFVLDGFIIRAAVMQQYGVGLFLMLNTHFKWVTHSVPGTILRASAL